MCYFVICNQNATCTFAKLYKSKFVVNKKYEVGYIKTAYMNQWICESIVEESY